MQRFPKLKRVTNVQKRRLGRSLISSACVFVHLQIKLYPWLSRPAHWLGGMLMSSWNTCTGTVSTCQGWWHISKHLNNKWKVRGFSFSLFLQECDHHVLWYIWWWGSGAYPSGKSSVRHYREQIACTLWRSWQSLTLKWSCLEFFYLLLTPNLLSILNSNVQLL